MKMLKSPLKIVLDRRRTPGQDLVFSTSAIIYGRSTGYYVIIGGFRLPVTLDGHGFRLQMSLWNFSRFLGLQQNKENTHHESNSAKEAAQGC